MRWEGSIMGVGKNNKNKRELLTAYQNAYHDLEYNYLLLKSLLYSLIKEHKEGIVLSVENLHASANIQVESLEEPGLYKITIPKEKTNE